MGFAAGDLGGGKPAPVEVDVHEVGEGQPDVVDEALPLEDGEAFAEDLPEPYKDYLIPATPEDVPQPPENIHN